MFRRLAVDALGTEHYAPGRWPHETHDALEGRGLAGAVAPKERDDLILTDAERDIVQHVALAIERIDCIDLDDRRRRDGCALYSRRRGPDRAVAEVHPLQLRVRADLRGSALGDHAALVHRRDAIGKLEHAVHVVLDQQDRHLRHEALDQPRDALALGRGEPDQRLVEQQHARSRRQRNADLEQPLPTVGQARHGHLLEAFESKEADQRVGLDADLRQR